MSGDHNQFQKDRSYLDFECPRCGHCCYVDDDDISQDHVDETVKSEQEPVAWIDQRIHGWPDCFVMQPDPPHTVPLYTAPQKQWVGLTEKEWYAATGIPRNAQLPMPMLKGIEKALKEKNG